MKKKIIYLILFASFFSCQDDYEKVNEEIKGTWKLESITYQDSSGAVKVISGSNITLTFLDDVKMTSSVDTGYQIVGNDSMFFYYYISPASYTFSFFESYYDTEKGYYETWPIDAIGRVLVYDFSKVDKNTIVFSCNAEDLFTTNERLSNVTYVYTKVTK